MDYSLKFKFKKENVNFNMKLTVMNFAAERTYPFLLKDFGLASRKSNGSKYSKCP